jgi:hypothetical protein
MLGGQVVMAQRENAVGARNQSHRAAIGTAIGIPTVAEVSRQTALTCSGSPTGCRLHGADALVRLDVKRPSADTAHGTGVSNPGNRFHTATRLARLAAPAPAAVLSK